MKRKFTFLFAALLFCSLGVFSQTNLIADWSGGKGTSNTPAAYGWLPETANWNTYNGGGGTRIIDTWTTYTIDGEVVLGLPILHLRWDGSGVGPGNCFALKVTNLEPCKTYTFTGRFGWHNNSPEPENTYTVGINSDPNNKGIVYGSSQVVMTQEERHENVNATNKGALLPLSFSFAVPAEGEYYLTIANDRGMMGAVTELSIVENESGVLDPRLNVDKSQFVFSDFNTSNQKMNVSGVIGEKVTITAPAGITVTPSEIEVASFDCAKSVLVDVALTDKSAAIDGEIIVKVGDGLTYADTIKLLYVKYDSKNLIAPAAGAGANILGEGTKPTDFGWQCTTIPEKVFTWANAGPVVGAVRYDAIAGYTYNEELLDGTGDGWALLLRWDGNAGTDSLSVYSYPVELKAGKEYDFKGKYSWHGNGIEAFFKFAINPTADNSAEALASVVYDFMDGSKDQKILRDANLTFIAPNTQTYYLTICMDPEYASIRSRIVGAIMDLSIVDKNPDGISSVLNNSQLTVFVDNNNNIVASVDMEAADEVEFAIYNLQGALVANETVVLSAGKNQKVIGNELPKGLYIVKMTTKKGAVAVKVLK